jgi:hypothetical protein
MWLYVRTLLWLTDTSSCQPRPGRESYISHRTIKRHPTLLRHTNTMHRHSQIHIHTHTYTPIWIVPYESIVKCTVCIVLVKSTPYNVIAVLQVEQWKGLPTFMELLIDTKSATLVVTQGWHTLKGKVLLKHWSHHRWYSTSMVTHTHNQHSACDTAQRNS